MYQKFHTSTVQSNQVYVKNLPSPLFLRLRSFIMPLTFTFSSGHVRLVLQNILFKYHIDIDMQDCMRNLIYHLFNIILQIGQLLI